MTDGDKRSGMQSPPTEPLDREAGSRPELARLPDDAASLEVEVIGGPMDGQRKTVAGPVLTIGRDERNDVVLALDRTISSRHAQIVREQDHFWLEDLDSRNGTFLGDRLIRNRTLIGPGTMFRVGRTSLEFVLH